MSTARRGVGVAGAHFGEILQGAFRLDGVVRRALVTLPLPGCGSRAVFEPRPESGIRLLCGSRPPESILKVRRAVRESLLLCGRESGGSLYLSGGVPAGRGMGSSTSEIVATIRAVSDAFGVSPTCEEVAEVASRCEVASDPLMFCEDAPLLFDSRQGRVLMRLGERLPRMEVIGVDTGEVGVGTDGLEPPEYTEDEILGFGRLLCELEEGILRGDVRAVGRVATQSALINERYLPKPDLETVMAVSEECGAVGVSVAHSGTVMGVIFAPESRSAPLADIPRAARILGEAGYSVRRFGVGGGVG